MLSRGMSSGSWLTRTLGLGCGCRVCDSGGLGKGGFVFDSEISRQDDVLPKPGLQAGGL